MYFMFLFELFILKNVIKDVCKKYFMVICDVITQYLKTTDITA